MRPQSVSNTGTRSQPDMPQMEISSGVGWILRDWSQLPSRRSR